MKEGGEEEEEESSEEEEEEELSPEKQGEDVKLIFSSLPCLLNLKANIQFEHREFEKEIPAFKQSTSYIVISH